MKNNELLYSVFQTEHYKMVSENKFEWVIGLAFYIGDMSKIDESKDERLKAAKGMSVRKQSIFLGLTYQKPPIQFPLILTNGRVIKQGFELKYSDR